MKTRLTPPEPPRESETRVAIVVPDIPHFGDVVTRFSDRRGGGQCRAWGGGPGAESVFAQATMLKKSKRGAAGSANPWVARLTPRAPRSAGHHAQEARQGAPPQHGAERAARAAAARPVAGAAAAAGGHLNMAQRAPHLNTARARLGLKAGARATGVLAATTIYYFVAHRVYFITILKHNKNKYVNKLLNGNKVIYNL